MSGFFWFAALSLVTAGQTPTPATPVPAQSPTPVQTPGQVIPPQVPAGTPTQPLPPITTSPTAPTVVGAPGNVTPGYIAPGYVTPGMAAAGNPMNPGYATPNAPVPAPVIVNANLNQDFSLGALQYRVVKVTPGLTSYTLQYDQRQARLTPGFKRDRLVIVDVEVSNPTNMPQAFTGITPALVDAGGAMTNRAQWDIRQQSFVRSSDDGAGGAGLRFSSYLSPEDAGPYADTTDAVMVAPGGHVHFALVFSEPAGARPGSIRFDGSQSYSAPTSPIGVVTLQ